MMFLYNTMTLNVITVSSHTIGPSERKSYVYGELMQLQSTHLSFGGLPHWSLVSGAGDPKSRVRDALEPRLLKVTHA